MKSSIKKVIIVYELYQREYDNALLLKAFLEGNGYEVEIVYKLNMVGLKYSDEPKIVFIPNCYSDWNFDWYYHNLNGNNYILIDLQYEQSLSNDKKNIEFHIPKGRAAEILHLCWGERYRKILLDYNIDNRLVETVGALHLDYVRPEFSGFWFSKDYISEKYQIPKEKKWNLFISSFALADNPMTQNAMYEHLGTEYTDYFSDFATNSRNKIIAWFKRFLSEHNEQVIIYRKHPTELISQSIESLREEYPNQFYLIDDYNIKQWIMISDIILTWYSTSVVECYSAKKTFHILRPCDIKEKYEVEMYVGGTFLKDYSSFEKTVLNCENSGYPIDVSGISETYKIDNKTAAESICDLLSKSFEYNYFETKKQFQSRRREIVRSHHGMIRYRFKNLYQKLYKRDLLRIKSKKIRNKFAVDEWEKLAKIEDRCEQVNKLNEIVKKIMEDKEYV